MIVNNEEALKRLNSPMNLINKIKNTTTRKDAMSLFGIGKEKIKEEVKITFNPFEKVQEPLRDSIDKALTTPVQISVSEANRETETKLGDLLDNHDSQIKLGLAHDQALALLNSSVALLATKLDDVKADKLPSVISAASKTVESIRRERNEQAKNGKNQDVHYHFYTPQQKTLADFQIIDVA